MANPLRVAVVSRAAMPLHGFGGLERATRDLVCHLARHGVRVTLITPPPGPEPVSTGDDPFASSNIEIRHVPYITFPLANRPGTTAIDRSTAYLLFALRAGRLAGALVDDGVVDVVHSQGAAGLGYARRRDRSAAPLVLNPHGLEEFGTAGGAWPMAKRLAYAPLRRAVRRTARAADCVISTDASLEPAILRHLRVPAERVRVVPNGIDLNEVTGLAGPADGAILRRRQGIGAGEIVLVSAGRLEENKGFDLLPEALARAAAPGSPLSACGWRWVVVGAGPRRRAIEAAVDRHEIGAHVTFAGRVAERDLHAWYEAATLFVHPTRYEGSSLVTLEAMAHRKPVIATRAGGLPDKVRPGLNGWLVEPGDVEGLASALAGAAANLAGLAAMGAHSRRIVEREFAWSAIVLRQVALYEELLAGRARAAS